MTQTKVKYLNRIVVLTPQKQLLGDSETNDLDTHIQDLDRGGNQHLVVNLKKATYITSAGIAVLLRGHKSYEARGGRMVLCCLNEVTNNILVVMKLNLVFDIYDTEEEAIASFAAPPPKVTTS
jgi:anti-sigma B factor antagonist